jgi:hypothetical protein
LIDAESSLTQAAANLSMDTLWSSPFASARLQQVDRYGGIVSMVRRG